MLHFRAQWRVQFFFHHGQTTCLGGAEIFSSEAKSGPKGVKQLFAPPNFISAPGAYHTKGRQNFIRIIIRDRQKPHWFESSGAYAPYAQRIDMPLILSSPIIFSPPLRSYALHFTWVCQRFVEHESKRDSALEEH